MARRVPSPSVEDLAELYRTQDIPPPPPPRDLSAQLPDEGWMPPLGPAQMRLFNSRARYILAHGERGSGKTWGLLHKYVKHAYENKNAHVLFVVGVRRQATAGGAWYKLLIDVLPEWKRNLEGFDHTDQKQNTEKDLFCWVSNRFGGWSMIHLISIPYGTSLVQRIKGAEPSAIFVDELTDIGGPEYFEALTKQLFRPGHIVPSSEHFYGAACNPAGPSHWVYKRFFDSPKLSDGSWNADYETVHVPIDQNPSPEAAAYYKMLVETTKHDPIEYARMIEGKWVERPSGEAIFAPYWFEELYAHGDPLEGEYPSPDPSLCCVLGYDLGDVNHSITFLQKLGHTWVAFDEVVLTDLKTPHEQIVRETMRRMNWWGQQVGDPLWFEHVSDRSAFDRFRAITGSYDHLEVQRLSAEELLKRGDIYPMLSKPIRMIPCPKPPGSVAARVRLVMTMLQRGELHVSRRCPRLLAMIASLESEKGDPFSPARSEHLHSFDSLSYPLYYHSLGAPVPPVPPPGMRKIVASVVR